jgi:hypothetical protein
MKFLSSELGANLEGHSVIKGKIETFTYEIMLQKLDKFIRMYVICPNCKYPELIMSPEGKKGLKSICKSCGNTNKHDAQNKAGKIILQQLQEGKQIGGDIGTSDIKDENDIGGMGVTSDNEDDIVDIKKKKKK